MSTVEKHLPEDHRAVSEVIQAFSDAFNRKNAADLASLFSENAEFVNVFGSRMRGRAGIEAGHAAGFSAPLKGATLALEVSDIIFVRPDVAVAVVKWERSTVPDAAQGTLAPASGVLMTVLVKDEKWQIVAAQNTQAAQPPGMPH